MKSWTAAGVNRVGQCHGSMMARIYGSGFVRQHLRITGSSKGQMISGFGDQGADQRREKTVFSQCAESHWPMDRHY
jgi:hypothetical protein